MNFKVSKIGGWNKFHSNRICIIVLYKTRNDKWMDRPMYMYSHMVASTSNLDQDLWFQTASEGAIWKSNLS